MKFDTPRRHQPDRSAEGDRSSPSTASTARSRRPAQRRMPTRGTTWRRTRPMAGSSGRPSPRAASAPWTSAQRVGRPAFSPSSRPTMPGPWPRATSIPPGCSAGRRSTTTTRRSRWSWPRPSSRRVRPRNCCASTTSAAPGRSTWRRRTSPASPPTFTAMPGTQRSATSTGAFSAAPVKVDAVYTTPDQSHAMMEPHGTTAAWNGDHLTVWTSNQMIDWGRADLAKSLGIPKEKVRLVSPFVGGGFGAKLFVRADALLAALGARAASRPVKVALQRALVANNTTHRPATIQRVRLGATAGRKAHRHRP